MNYFSELESTPTLYRSAVIITYSPPPHFEKENGSFYGETQMKTVFTGGSTLSPKVSEGRINERPCYSGMVRGKNGV